MAGTTEIGGISVSISANTSKLDAAINDANAKIQNLGTGVVTISAQVDTASITSAVSSAKSEIKRLSRASKAEPIPVQFQFGNSAHTAKLLKREIGKELNKIGGIEVGLKPMKGAETALRESIADFAIVVPVAFTWNGRWEGPGPSSAGGAVPVGPGGGGAGGGRNVGDLMRMKQDVGGGGAKSWFPGREEPAAPAATSGTVICPVCNRQFKQGGAYASHKRAEDARAKRDRADAQAATQAPSTSARAATPEKAAATTGKAVAEAIREEPVAVKPTPKAETQAKAAKPPTAGGGERTEENLARIQALKLMQDRQFLRGYGIKGAEPTQAEFPGLMKKVKEQVKAGEGQAGPGSLLQARTFLQGGITAGDVGNVGPALESAQQKFYGAPVATPAAATAATGGAADTPKNLKPCPNAICQSWYDPSGGGWNKHQQTKRHRDAVALTPKKGQAPAGAVAEPAKAGEGIRWNIPASDALQEGQQASVTSARGIYQPGDARYKAMEQQRAGEAESRDIPSLGRLFQQYIAAGGDVRMGQRGHPGPLPGREEEFEGAFPGWGAKRSVLNRKQIQEEVSQRSARLREQERVHLLTQASYAGEFTQSPNLRKAKLYQMVTRIAAKRAGLDPDDPELGLTPSPEFSDIREQFRARYRQTEEGGMEPIGGYDINYPPEYKGRLGILRGMVGEGQEMAMPADLPVEKLQELHEKYPDDDEKLKKAIEKERKKLPEPERGEQGSTAGLGEAIGAGYDLRRHAMRTIAERSVRSATRKSARRREAGETVPEDAVTRATRKGSKRVQRLVGQGRKPAGPIRNIEDLAILETQGLIEQAKAVPGMRAEDVTASEIAKGAQESREFNEEIGVAPNAAPQTVATDPMKALQEQRKTLESRMDVLAERVKAAIVTGTKGEIGSHRGATLSDELLADTAALEKLQDQLQVVEKQITGLISAPEGGTTPYQEAPKKGKTTPSARRPRGRVEQRLAEASARSAKVQSPHLTRPATLAEINAEAEARTASQARRDEERQASIVMQHAEVDLTPDQIRENIARERSERVRNIRNYLGVRAERRARGPAISNPEPQQRAAEPGGPNIPGFAGGYNPDAPLGAAIPGETLSQRMQRVAGPQASIERGLVGSATPAEEPFVPAWRKRENAKDLTRYASGGGEESYKCECGRSFTTARGLATHKRSHKAEAAGPVAGASNKEPQAIRELREAAKKATEARVEAEIEATISNTIPAAGGASPPPPPGGGGYKKCDVCGREFVNAGSLASHKKSKHATAPAAAAVAPEAAPEAPAAAGEPIRTRAGTKAEKTAAESGATFFCSTCNRQVKKAGHEGTAMHKNARMKATAEPPGTPRVAGGVDIGAEGGPEIADKEERIRSIGNIKATLDVSDLEDIGDSVRKAEDVFKDVASEARDFASQVVQENPVRALSVAVGQVLVNTIGGRANLVKQQKAIDREAGELTKTARLYGRALERQEQAQARVDQIKKGAPERFAGEAERITTELQPRLREATIRRGAAATEKAEEVEGMRDKLQAQRVRRGFATLAVGTVGIVGGTMLFQGAMAAAALATEQLGIGMGRAIGRMSDFEQKTGELASSMGDATRANFGNVEGTVAGQLAMAGFGMETANSIKPLIELRTQVIAGTKAFEEQLDLMRAARNIGEGVREGVDVRGLTETTGGFPLMNIGGQRSIRELLTTELNAQQLTAEQRASGGSRNKTQVEQLMNPFATIPGLNLLTGSVEISAEQISRDTEMLKDNVSHWNDQAQKGSSLFELAAGDATEVAEQTAALAAADFEGAEELGKALDKNDLVLRNKQTGEIATAEEDYLNYLQGITQGSTAPEERLLVEQQSRQLRAQMQGRGMMGELQRETVLPAQQYLSQLARPMVPFAQTTAARTPGAEDAANFQSSKAAIDSAQASLQGYADAGEKAAMEIIRGADALTGSNLTAQWQKATSAVASYGKQIQSISLGSMWKQVNLQVAQYDEQLRVSNRSLADAREFLTGIDQAGNNNLGLLERQSLMYSRQSAQIGFQQQSLGIQSQQLGLQNQQLGIRSKELSIQSAELGRQSQMLGFQSQSMQLMQNQRQINFQVAMAGFSAPGTTPEERAARMEQAKVEADFAQKQQDIAMEQFDIAKEMFGIEGIQLGIQVQTLDLDKQQYALQVQQVALAQQAYGISVAAYNVQQAIVQVNAAQAVEDLEHQISLLTQARTVTIEVALDQEALQNLEAAQAAEMAQAQAVLEQAVDIRQQVISAQVSIAAQLGKAVAGYASAVLSALGLSFQQIDRYLLNSLSGYANMNPPRASTGGYNVGSEWQYNAAGFLGNINGATQMVVGEAGPETVAILRNPREMTMGDGGGGAGGGSPTYIQINVTGNTVRNDEDLDTLAAVVARKVEETMGRRASQLGFRAAR